MLLGSSALSAAALAMLLAGPQAALAACDVTSNPNSVICAADTTTTNTTNINGATASSSDRTQEFTANGNVTATVNNNVTVGGEGLAVATTQAGSTLSFTNNGLVTRAVLGDGALRLTGNGGLVTYTGLGSISATSTSTPALSVDNTGNGAIAVTTNGSITGGASGIQTQTATGAIAITVNGGTVSGDETAIAAFANGGITTITLNGGTVSSVQSYAIDARDTGGGSVVVNANGGSLASDGDRAIFATSGAGNVTVNAAGTAISSTNAFAIIARTTGGGNVSVNVTGGSITARDEAIIATGSGAGTIDVTIGAGVTVARTGSSGYALRMSGGTGTATATVLGTLSGVHGAADFRGTLNVGNGGTTGTLIGGVKMTDAAAMLRFNRSDAYSYAGVIGDAGGGGSTLGNVEILGGGTATFTGTSIYTGTTTVTGSGLIVNGRLTQTSALTTTGTSTLGIGATGSINVTGNLVLSATGNYAVFGTATFGAVTVNGTASLDGRIIVTTAAGARAGTYTLLTATGGFVSGQTTFATTQFDISLSPTVRNPTITYDATHVYLTLAPGTIQLPAGTGGNLMAVAGGINNAVLGGANPSPGFNTLLGLSGTALTNALAQVSGEGGHGATQTAANTAANQFINTMFDPSIDGRGGAGGPANYAEDDNDELAYAGKRKRSKAERDALKAVTPRDRRYDAFTPRFSVWAAGYGGAASVEGNASSGTHSTTSRIYGTAVGADIRIGIDTVVGLAMGGGGTSFNTADGLGSGSADLFQVGVHGRRHFGAAYVAGALAYGWQDVTTDRTVTVAGTDRLRANFNAHTFAARGETGYRFGPVVMGVPFGITPYAALQVTRFFLPDYSETAVSGSNQFALAFASQSESNVRTELGVRADKSFAMRDGVMTLRGRAAWAHDSNTDRAVSPTFQSLPGSSFTVNGAKPSADGALLSAGTEMKWRNGWSMAGLFEGEFSGTTESYSGKGSIRRAW